MSYATRGLWLLRIPLALTVVQSMIAVRSMQPFTRSSIRRKEMRMVAGLFVLLAAMISGVSDAAEREYSGQVFTGPSDPGAVITKLRIDLRHVPRGMVSYYDPEDYPELTDLVLEDGTKISFKRLKEIAFTAAEVTKRKFVPEHRRERYAPGAVDEEGYVTFSEVEVRADAVLLDGKRISGALKNPGKLYLIGLDDEDEFEVRLDEAGTKRRVVFDHAR